MWSIIAQMINNHPLKQKKHEEVATKSLFNCLRKGSSFTNGYVLDYVLGILLCWVLCKYCLLAGSFMSLNDLKWNSTWISGSVAKGIEARFHTKLHGYDHGS